jgi:transglutaminase-like putative cysteine protease
MGRGQKIEEILWTDRAGEILKRRSEAMMNMETVRATKELALAKTGAASFDLGRDVLVKLDRPLAQAHDTRLARYRVRLEGGDPAKTFPSSPAQQVKPIDAHTAEITVRAVRPGMRQGGPVGPADPPTDADRQPNNFIQSDDAKVVADAREAAAGETDPWRVAVAVERYVERVMTKKDFTQAFATAAEVARNREGDCTEHAVYLAALARARGIPARVAMGLVYLPRARAFGYHMWTEVYVGGQWIGMDGTLGKGGIGAGHLRLAHSSLEGNSAYSSFLPIVQVAGRLRIELLEAE